MIIIPKKNRFVFKHVLQTFLQKCNISRAFFSNGKNKYDKVIISLNNETPPVFTLETGVEVAKLLSLPFTILYVVKPYDMHMQQDIEYLNFRKI